MYEIVIVCINNINIIELFGVDIMYCISVHRSACTCNWSALNVQLEVHALLKE